MSILVDLYNFRSLTEAVNIMRVPEPFVLSKIFNTKESHESDYIDFEVIRGSSEIANHVHSEALEPIVVGKKGVVVNTFKLPRTYERKIFSAQELSKLSKIGDIYGSREARKAAQMDYIQRELESLKSRVIRLKEKIACEVISTGKYTVTQDNISMTYDMLFEDDKQLVTLSGAKLWTADTGNPLVNLREWKRAISQRSGVPALIVLLGTTAAEAFINNKKVMAQLDTNNLKVGSLDLNVDEAGSVIPIGRFGGVNVYEYNQQYTNDSGTDVDMIPADRAIIIGNTKNNRLHYGAIYRMRNNIAEPIISEYLLDPQEEKLGVLWDLEQKSLPVVHDAGAIISAKVV